MANVSKKIPTNTQPTWQADINGKRYEYASGKTVSVPEEVAALIDDAEAGMAKEDPRASQRGIEKDVTQIVKDNFEGGVGYEETNEVVMLPETSFEVGAEGVMLSESFPYTFEAGKEYVVNLDGVTNTYTAELFEPIDSVIITNTSAEELMKGNGWLCKMENGALFFLTEDASFFGTHTIKISDVTTTTHKIGSKYLPENEPLVLYAKQM